MSGKLSEVEKDELFDQLKQQNVMMNTKRLLEVSSADSLNHDRSQHNKCLPRFCLSIQSITEKCFKKCVVKPGSSLDSSERVIIQDEI